MYAVEGVVRELCVNVRTGFTTGLFDAQAAMADAELNAALSARFWWPTSSGGDDLRTSPPELIVQIANHMVASRIESLSYAQNEAGLNQPNPYGASLGKIAKNLLNGILEGRVLMRELEKRKELKVTQVPQTFKPSNGLAKSGRRGLA